MLSSEGAAQATTAPASGDAQAVVQHAGGGGPEHGGLQAREEGTGKQKAQHRLPPPGAALCIGHVM